MFAGPNGSGKSTIKEVVPSSIRGTYINPDDLASALVSNKGQSFDEFGLDFDLSGFRAFIQGSEFLRTHRTSELAAEMELRSNVAFYLGNAGIGYLASALSDYLRRKMMEKNRWFSFETVMSSHDKVELLRAAQAQGYRTYLYYIATDHVRINIARVAARVRLEGHDVPEDKIRARYLRSLEL